MPLNFELRVTSETNDEAQHPHLHRVQSLCVREAGGVHGAGVVFPEWQGRSPWLQKAINELVREVREQLIGLGKALRHEKLAAWGFHPPLETERFEVRLETGGQSATVKLLAVVMPALGRQMAFTPSIPEAWFEVLPGESVKTRLGEALSAYLKQQERESGSRSLDWSREVVAQLAKTGFDSR